MQAEQLPANNVTMRRTAGSITVAVFIEEHLPAGETESVLDWPATNALASEFIESVLAEDTEAVATE